MQNRHNEKVSDVTGVLLAGGQSRRMGRDKAHTVVGGRPLYTRPLDFLRQHFETVFISGDRPDLASTGVPALADLYPGSSLGGLFTALKAAETSWIFILPCDLPYPDDRILRLLLARREAADAVVPYSLKGYEPLFAVYHKHCLGPIEAMLREDRFRISELFPLIRLCRLDWQEFPDGWERSLRNVNTPEQLRQLQKDSA